MDDCEEDFEKIDVTNGGPTILIQEFVDYGYQSWIFWRVMFGYVITLCCVNVVPFLYHYISKGYRGRVNVILSGLTIFFYGGKLVLDREDMFASLVVSMISTLITYNVIEYSRDVYDAKLVRIKRKQLYGLLRMVLARLYGAFLVFLFPSDDLVDENFYSVQKMDNGIEKFLVKRNRESVETRKSTDDFVCQLLEDARCYYEEILKLEFCEEDYPVKVCLHNLFKKDGVFDCFYGWFKIMKHSGDNAPYLLLKETAQIKILADNMRVLHIKTKDMYIELKKYPEHGDVGEPIFQRLGC